MMLPLLSAPLQAQETPVEEPVPAAEEPVTTVEVEEEVEETVVIEEPRVLISEVLIVGLSAVSYTHLTLPTNDLV